MRKRISLQLNKNSGFTLVELIVVLVLISILLSITIIGGLGWQDWAQFKHENDVAEDIFYAAQNQLMELDASGSMDSKVVRKLKETAPEDRTLDYASTMILDKSVLNGSSGIAYAMEGETKIYYDWNTIWTNSDNRNKNKNVQSSTLLRLTAEAGDYEKYLAGTLVQGDDKSKIGTKVLFDLISSYLSDTGVLNGAIALEFSPDAGQVFSVSYTDRHDVLAYHDTDQTNPEKKYISVMDRYVQYRQDNMIGYFSVDELAQKIKGRGENKNFLKLEIENGNLLLLKITDEAEDDTNKLKATDSMVFTIYDGATGNKAMLFSVVKKDIPEAASFATGLSFASEKPVVVNTFEIYEGTYKNHDDINTFRLPMWRQGDEYYIVLDAADVQAQTVSYNDSDAGRTFDSASDRSFLNTFSFYRFGLSETLNYIYADVKIQNGVDWTFSAKKDSGRTEGNTFVKHKDMEGLPKGECTTFESYTKTSDTASIEIKNARHFYNIRYETDYKIDPNRKNDFILINDIIWSKFIKDDAKILNEDGAEIANPRADSNYFLNSYDNTIGANHIVAGIDYDGTFYATKSVANQDRLLTNDYPFPGFRKLDKNDTFTQNSPYDRATYKGTRDSSVLDSANKNYTISDLTISISANIVYGVYGNDIKNKCVVNGSENYDAILGLNSITNDSTGSNAARGGKLPLGLFAENLGTIKNITLDKHVVEGLEKLDCGIVYTCMVGGFAGDNIGVIENLTLLDTADNPSTPDVYEFGTHINGRTDVGGIIGRESFVVEGATKDVEIENMINYGKVTGMENVGGIVGRAYDGYFGEENPDEYHSYSVSDVNNFRYKFYHDGYSISDDGLSMAGEKVDRASRILIKDCINRGRVSGDEIVYNNLIDEKGGIKCSFIGGIAGITMDGVVTDSNEDYGNITYRYEPYRNGTTYKVMIENCNSFVSLKKYGLTLFEVGDTDKCKSLVRDNYVGGLVGYGRATAIKNCNATPDSDMMVTYDGKEAKEAVDAYVMGNRYVGGIFGCSDFCRYDKEGSSSKAVTNYNNVIGRFIVGGVMGGNGVGDSSQRQNLTFRNPSENLAFQVSQYRGTNGTTFELARNAMNKGVVLALRTEKSFTKKICDHWEWQHDISMNPDYAIQADEELTGLCGGIFGMSRAGVFNCDNIQSEDTKALAMILITGKTSNYNLWDMNDAEYESVLKNSKFGGNAVGGIGGYISEYGMINPKLGDKTYSSSVDAVIFGKQYVGGVLGTESKKDSQAIKNCYPIKEVGSSGMLVCGRDCVGGLLGRSVRSFNNTNAITSTYNVRGRYGIGGMVGALTSNEDFTATMSVADNVASSEKYHVYGKAYVGGCAGVCSGAGIKFIGSIQNVDVEGAVFVGGIAGAVCGTSNVHNLSNCREKKISQRGNVAVKAKAFAGGISGLYMVESSVDDFYGNSGDSVSKGATGTDETGKLILLADRIESAIRDKSDSEIPDIIYGQVVDLDVDASGINFKTAFPTKTATESIIDFSKDYKDKLSSINSYSNTATVEAEIFAGGLFGYVPNGTNVTVKRFVNNGNIKTASTITGDYVKEDVNSNSTIKYSYLGGIVGRVPSGMKLVKCYNIISGQDTNASTYYVSNATYMGSLTEVNAGVITGTDERNKANSEETVATGSIKDNSYCKSGVDREYSDVSIGAFAGINGTRFTNGKIDSETGAPADDATGVIAYCYNYGKITASNSAGQNESLVAGGMTAAIGGPSVIYGCKNEGDITGVGYAGGMAASTFSGYNGSVEENKNTIKVLDSINVGSIEITSEEEGSKAAGIITGTNGCGDIELCRNYGKITGVERYGIVGDSASTVTRNLEAGGLEKVENTDPVAPKESKDLTRNFYIGNLLEEANIDKTALKDDSGNDSGNVYFYATQEKNADNTVVETNGTDSDSLKVYDTVPKDDLNKISVSKSQEDDPNKTCDIKIAVKGYANGIEMNYFKIYWAFPDETKPYRYTVSYDYYDYERNIQTITYAREVYADSSSYIDGDGNVIAYDKIPVENYNGDEIWPINIQVHVDRDYYDVDMDLYYTAMTWGVEDTTAVNSTICYERKFVNSANQYPYGVQNMYSPEAPGIISVPADVYEVILSVGENVFGGMSYTDSGDFWSKQLYVVRSGGNYYNLAFKRNGKVYRKDSDVNASYGLLDMNTTKNLKLSDDSTASNRKDVMNILDEWFMREFVDSTEYPNGYFVGTMGD